MGMTEWELRLDLGWTVTMELLATVLAVLLMLAQKKYILKTSVNLTDTVDDLSEGTLSPLAGNGLVASSFTEEIAPAILPTSADSWELPPISGEGSLMDDRLQHLLRNSLLRVFTQHLVPVNKSGSGHHLVFAGD